jgi:hypothetical protein
MMARRAGGVFIARQNLVIKQQFTQLLFCRISGREVGIIGGYGKG